MSDISKIKLPNGNTYSIKDSSVPDWARGTGKIPSDSLPSYVDDVIEGYYINDFFYLNKEGTQIIAGETGKIYVDLPTNKIYRYSGTTYIVIPTGEEYNDATTSKSGLMSAADKTKLDSLSMKLVYENGKVYAEFI